jgi:superoxide dismutase, Cu-Zn family
MITQIFVKEDSILSYRGWLTIISLLPLTFLMGCGPSQQPQQEMAAPVEPMAITAHAELQPTQGNTAQGTVHFEDDQGEIHVEISLTGLTPGMHGIHIHETGDCSAPDASSAGGHFNPDGKAHGAPDAMEHHVGDLGNIEADADGQFMADLHFDFLSLDGPNSLRGKAVVVHAGEDDMESQPSGDSGARVACGVIQ